MGRGWTWQLVALLAALGLSWPGAAQTPRDPTRSPIRPDSMTGGDVAASSETARPLLSVLRVDGQLRVLHGSRLYAVGAKLGQATLVRITETEIWLREGKEIKKIALHEGVRWVPHVPSQE